MLMYTGYIELIALQLKDKSSSIVNILLHF